MVAAFYMKKCSVFQYLKFRFLILNLHGRPATKPPVPSFAAQRFSGGVSPEAGVPSTIDRIEIQAGGGYASGEEGPENHSSQLHHSHSHPLLESRFGRSSMGLPLPAIHPLRTVAPRN